MTSECVLIVFTPLEPIVGIVDRHPSGTLSLRGQTYVQQHFARDSFLGFYDWLRTFDGDLVGFRLTVGIGCQSLTGFIPTHSYVFLEGDVLTVVWGRAESKVDEEASAEQDFGASHAFVSERGELVLAIDGSALTKEELATLESIQVSEK